MKKRELSGQTHMLLIVFELKSLIGKELIDLSDQLYSIVDQSDRGA